MSVADYKRPVSLAEVWSLKAKHPDALYIAGGTDLLVQIRAARDRSHVLISLRNIDELKAISLSKTVRIGSMTTIADILADERLGKIYPILQDAARPFASMQVRNQATVGGNLCNASPCADMGTALLALDARICLTGPDGEREVMLDDFFLGQGKTCRSPDEVLTSIVLEKPSPTVRAVYLKKRRVWMDLALVSVAVLLDMKKGRCTRARITAGAVAPRQLRLRTVEAALEGHHIDEDLLTRARKLAEQEVSPITDVRTSEEYRRHMTGILFKRAVDSLLDRSENDR